MRGRGRKDCDIIRSFNGTLGYKYKQQNGKYEQYNTDDLKLQIIAFTSNHYFGLGKL